MTSPKAKQKHEHRDGLADLITRRRAEIERRWLERVRPPPHGRHVSPTELMNSMPEYLMRLGDGLRDKRSAEAGGVASWENVAQQHAETRVRLGFDIGQLVHEFIILRRVLFGMLEEEGMRLDLRQSARLADLIEGAIAAAVKSYVSSRDDQLRRQEAEHIGFITHELRNPLATATLGAIQLRRTLGSLSPEQARTFDIVERSHRRLADLIAGVLLVERDAHELEPQRRAVSLGQLLEETLVGAELGADAKRIRFEARFDPELVVEVDPKLARSAISNVVENAIKYTDAGGVQLVVEERPADIVVHVRDSCRGIAADDLRTIFEPFRRGRSDKPGAGLGLAIARKALEVQGGSINAESGEGSGCHFWLTLPKHVGPEGKHGARSPHQ